MNTVIERFINFIKQDTQSNYFSQTHPSTKNQLEFAALLYKECKEIGFTEVTIDEKGYIMATVPSNIKETVPTIGFIAHMDTSPDASGKNVQPQIIQNYDGNDIILSKEKNIILSPKDFPDLLLYQNDTIITSNGTTLLGADDKAGIAEILAAMEYLIKHNEILHGKIRICFTPDEEIGKGADFFDVKAFGADFAYTIDGGKIGELEYENFNAARANISIKGKSVHPGTAKNIMKNASLIAIELANEFPSKETPAYTENYEGFFHLCNMKGEVESAFLSYIIRDFDTIHFEDRKNFVKELVEKYNQKYNNCISLDLHDEYLNMASKIKDHMQIIDLAEQAMKECNITPIIQPIRGGTDGARLSYMGLPCPNLFTGGHNFHGAYEFIPVSSMEKAVELIVKISESAVKIKSF